MRKFLRLIAINTVLVVGVWLVLLVLTALAGDVINRVKMIRPSADDRANLPNYPDKHRARRLFADLKQTVEDYVPYVVWRRLPMQTEFVNIGEDGLRLHTVGRENNDADAATIGFFGGSTMWGTGVDDDSTIAALFDQLTTDFEVTNYGEGGHTTRQTLALLVNLINTDRMPEVVVFYGGFNHVWTHCNYAVTRNLNGHMVEAKLRRALTERPRGGYLWADVVSPPLEFFRRVIGEKKFVRNHHVCHSDAERARAVADVLVRSWEIANMLVTGHGGRFFAFLQPVAYIGEPRVDHLALGRELAADQFRAVYPLVLEKVAERGMDYVYDLTDAFDVDEYVYIDDAHVTRPGNEIVARRILDDIVGP
jgi:hypothetical protein